MKSLNHHIEEYKKQLKKGDIQKAYLGLMEYMMSLKTYFQKKYPEYSVPSSIYFGYMDMTYFPLFPKFLKNKRLKIAIVLVHEKMRFEIWLSAVNKQVQKKYWEIVKEKKWHKYHIPPSVNGYDSIVESTLVEDPNFDNLDGLTKQIEKGTLNFIKNIKKFIHDKF